MSQRERLLAVVEQDLHDDHADYRRLQALMPALYQQLLARDCLRIDGLNQQIVALVEQVRSRADRRSKVLAALRLGSGAVAMQQLFGLFPAQRRDALQRLWSELGELAAECKRQNERNGQLLAMHHEILEQLLGVAHGAQLYGPSVHAY